MSDGSKLLLVSAAALVNEDGRVLVQRRPARGEHGGLWEFPGGKLDPGENPIDALIRELREELGIDIDTAGLTPAGFASEPWGDRHLLLLLFICRGWRGIPEPLQASELRWLTPRELYGLAMPPADLPLIGRLDTLLSSGEIAAWHQPDK